MSETHPNNLHKLLKSYPSTFSLATLSGSCQLLRVARQVLSGLEYMNKHGITNRNLQLENILIDDQGCIKLFNYGLYYMTNGGKYVTFPIGSPKYLSPEVFLNKTRSGILMHYCDTWAVGLILLELVLGRELWTDLKLPEMIQKINTIHKVGATNKTASALSLVLEQEGVPHLQTEMSPAVKTLIERCLIINPCNRPWPKQLLKDIRIFPQTNEIISKSQEEDGVGFQSWRNPCRSASLPFTINFSETCTLDNNLGNGDNQKDNVKENGKNNDEDGPIQIRDINDGASSPDVISSLKLSTDTSGLLKFRSLKEVYYLWQLAGGDVIAELKRQGLTRKKPAVLSVPKYGLKFY